MCYYVTDLRALSIEARLIFPEKNADSIVSTLAKTLCNFSRNFTVTVKLFGDGLCVSKAKPL